LLASFAIFVIRPTYVAALTILSRNEVRSTCAFAIPSVPSRRFRGLRNILSAGRLASISIEHEERASGRKKGLRLHVPQMKDDRNGTLHQRHQDHERPVHTSIAGHLLRRETTREGSAQNGRKGHRQAAQAGFFDPSRR